MEKENITFSKENEINNKTNITEEKQKENPIELIYFQSEFLLKEYCLQISNQLKLFLKEESIFLDEKSLSAIDKNTKNSIDFIIKNFESTFIKLNFSSGSDCFFMVNKLRCTKLDEILILLKSSSKLQENLFEEKEENKKIVDLAYFKLNSDKLFLKKWYKIDMRKEFRVVYFKRDFIISQRHCDICFDYEFNELAEIKEIIKNFFEEYFVYENFELEAKVLIFNNENTDISFKKKNLNYFDFHFIEKNDYENEILLIDLLLVNSNNKKIKIIDVITEKQRNKLAYKLDDYDIKNFLPLVFEKYKNSDLYNNKVHKENDDLENKEFLDDEAIEKENKYFEVFTIEYLIDKQINCQDDLKKSFFYIGKDDKIIEKDENYNKFPQELIDNQSNMLQFLKKLEISNNK